MTTAVAAQDRFRTSPQFLRGRGGEQIVKRFLQARGWWVVPSYDYTGEHGDKAPRMESLNRRLVIPDLDIAKGGDRRWAEVKTKRAPNLWRRTQTLEHGIDKRHYEHYREVQLITGAHVWLFIVEEDTQCIRAESLDRLGAPRIGLQYGKGGMVNWPVTQFSICVLASRVPGLFPPQEQMP